MIYLFYYLSLEEYMTFLNASTKYLSFFGSIDATGKQLIFINLNFYSVTYTHIYTYIFVFTLYTRNF